MITSEEFTKTIPGRLDNATAIANWKDAAKHSFHIARLLGMISDTDKRICRGVESNPQILGACLNKRVRLMLELRQVIAGQSEGI